MQPRDEKRQYVDHLSYVMIYLSQFSSCSALYLCLSVFLRLRIHTRSAQYIDFCHATRSTQARFAAAVLSVRLSVARVISVRRIIKHFPLPT